jgi:hypothetical protein
MLTIYNDWDLSPSGTEDIYAPMSGVYTDTCYQEQIEQVVADSARLFQYWILESGVTAYMDVEACRVDKPCHNLGVEGMYTQSLYAFDHHLMVIRRLFEYGEPLFGSLGSLLMQSIQAKWPNGGCPWVIDVPTEYNMDCSQIDWIFQVVGEHVGTRSTGILHSFEPRQYYGYLPSLRILNDIVVRLVLVEKYMECRRLSKTMSTRKDNSI